MTSEQWSLAALYWRAGFDTLDIAMMFDMPEHEIYNGLSKRRELNRCR